MVSALIVMYHRVAELRPDTHRLCTPPERFRAQMRWLAENRRPMPLAELAATRDPLGVAVTLDDGTRDALTAAEILDQAGVPATFFVGDASDQPRESWWDTLERIFFADAPLPDHFGELSTHDRAAAHQAVRARIFNLGAAAQAQLLDEVAAWSGADLRPRESHRLLLSGEIAALRHHAIGAHGLRHLHLPSLPPEEQREELAQSRAHLQSLLQRPVTELAYAYGACDDQVVALARELGFTCAVTVEDRAVAEGDDGLRLPRVRALE